MGGNPNRRAGDAIAAELARSGVMNACLSPGSRSTPIVLALARQARIRSWVVTDERSAGFFALGMARETARPVVLACTSGTAAANYLPAVVEASLAGVPLVVLTADRPPELRGCRAPQTIDQVRLFGSHVRWSVDAPAPESGTDLDRYWRTLACRAVATAVEPPGGPVHLNLPFREPLIDVEEELDEAPTDMDGPPSVVVWGPGGLPRDGAIEAIAARIEGRRRGLVLCGPACVDLEAAAPLTALARRTGWPVLADPLSGLRFGDHDRSAIVDAYDVLLRDPGFAVPHRPEAVLQLGTLPASKPLQRFLESSPPPVHVVVAAPGTWPDFLQSATDLVHADAGLFARELARVLRGSPGTGAWLASWRDAASRVRTALDGLVTGEAEIFEGRIFPVLHDLLPDGSAIHVGNSMPARDVDTFLGGSSRRLSLHGNRGANGIDGVLSTALGAAAVRDAPTLLVVGDLSFLHDQGGLQIAARHRIHLVVVVVNNDGGGIFSFLPQSALSERFERYFGTPHGLDLAGAVATAGGRHVLARSWRDFTEAVEQGLAARGLHVVEVRTDRTRNALRHREILEAALGGLGSVEEVA